MHSLRNLIVGTDAANLLATDGTVSVTESDNVKAVYTDCFNSTLPTTWDDWAPEEACDAVDVVPTPWAVKDALGTVRPQDGDDDGVIQGDAGAVERP